MWNCPVCDRTNDTPLCPGCGFDASRDYGRFPTFGVVPDAVSASGLRRKRSALVICPDCGGDAFSLERDTGLARCRVCGRPHGAVSAAPAKKTITAIACGDAHTVALYSDGTVRAVGKNNFGQCNTGAWKDIVSISAGYENTLGLRADGTVVAVGNNFKGKSMVHTLSGIRAISASNSGHTLFLREDGTVASLGDNDDDQRNLDDWRSIIAVSAGSGFSLGLKRNGTVLAVGRNDDGRCDTQSWQKQFTAVSAGNWHALALTRRGTAVATGYNESQQCDVSDWKDLIGLCGGKYFSAGLRSDGTVCITSNEVAYQIAEGWTDITAIAAGDEHLVGLRADGALVAAGFNKEGPCDVDRLMPEQLR